MFPRKIFRQVYHAQKTLSLDGEKFAGEIFCDIIQRGRSRGVEKYFMAALGGADGLGNKSIKLLVEHFGDAKTAWSAEAFDLRKSGVRRNSLEAFLAFRAEHPNAPENIAAYCQRQKINLCSIRDDDYPPLLKEIDSPPMFFYYRGKLHPQAQRIAIVGSRENTAYGQSVALELGRDLATAGVTVVSGAARGIDTFAHRGALQTGRTVAVLGCGINVIFPRENRKLLEQIAENGVVLSEFPPQMPPNQGTFPTRNRIIAGLSRGIIVVEAGKKSGALITVKYAGIYSRDVFAIPGQVYAEKSEGCNELIRDGATLIKNAQDVLDEYDLVVEKIPEPELDLPEMTAKVLEVIPRDDFITDDKIFELIDELEPDELSDILLDLELKHCIEADDLGRYRRKK